MPFDLDLNDIEVERELLESFKETNELFARESKEEITANKWSWPEGQSPRDIVDDGVLRDSYVPGPGQGEYEHTWNADYAAAVHDGAVFSDGREMPDRPWTKEPLEQFPENFEKIANAKLRSVK